MKPVKTAEQQHRDAARKRLLKALRLMNDEAFSWVALACLSSAMLHGARTQIWPDGLGGFTDRARIGEARGAAAAYCNLETPDDGDAGAAK